MSGWVLRLYGLSPALIGGMTDAPIGVHATTARLATAPGGPARLLLPGTSLRGVLRDAFRRFVTAKGEPCSDDEGCTCPTCRLFGRADQAGALWVRSAVAEGEVVLAPGVAIERGLRTVARERRALWIEERGQADFDVEVTAPYGLGKREFELLEAFWAWLQLLGLAVGRRKSAGLGRLEVRVESRPVPRRPVPAPSGAQEPGQRYLLRLTLLEPTRLVGLRQRDFYRESMDAIPVSTLRGALGWALERAGETAVLEDLFVVRPVVLTSAIIEDAGAGSSWPWLTRHRCDGDPTHLIDGALLRTAVALGAVRSEPGEDCPLCGSSLREYEPPKPRTMVMGHVSLEPSLRRARRGDLHYQVALSPGNVFLAELHARPSQAAALRELGEVFIGGRRARGMGRVQLQVEDLPSLAPIEDRVEATSSALASTYGIEGPRIAVLGLLSDGALERPLRHVLAEKGLEVVTGDVRDVVRGGWDERHGRPRSLRRLLQAGSWLAVRVTGDAALQALKQLESEGVPDREEVAPLVVRVRDDWMSTDWEVREMGVVGAEKGMTASEMDELVRGVRSLCEENRDSLPDRSALQTLLRFADSTPSVEETVLFIEYQASRDQFRKHRAFLTAVADEIRKRYLGDVEGARRFLGLLVRAGYVEIERRRRESSRRRGESDVGR